MIQDIRSNAVHERGAAHFLEKNTVGAILRGFAGTQESVPARVKQLLGTVEMLQTLRHHPEKNTIKRVDIWVASDRARKDHDCGKLAEALVVEIIERDIPNVWVHEMKHGDIFCQILNRAVAVQLVKGCSHSLILSSEADSNITHDSFACMLGALDEGALVTGLGFDAIKPYVMQGYIMNTCSLWHNISLMQVGGFDTMCEQRRLDDPRRSTIPAWDDERRDKAGNILPADYEYDEHGVEEVPTLIKLLDAFGEGEDGFEFIAPIPGTGDWNKPDPEKDPMAYARFVNKMGTKWQRMQNWAYMMHTDISRIRKGVMKKYRQTSVVA
ncbi:MAG: hypothetical protein Q7S04_03730 [Candidatus Moranbacteria bacterium]|nr:hypothetical protein [Candidatus Moranbacteria bacterium]